MVSERDVVSLLIDEGLLGQQVLVEGVRVVDASSRHRNFLVETASGDGLFVKTADEPGALDAEVEWYRRLGPDLADRAFVPVLIAHRREAGLLVLRAPRRARDLVVHHDRQGRFDPATGEAVGSALASLHATARRRDDSGHPPTFLTLLRPSPDDLARHTPATRDLIATLQQDVAAPGALDTLRTSWTSARVVHNDVKWRNILLVDTASPESVWLIDWEHAGTGDPAWDLGSALAAYVTCWLWSIPAPDGPWSAGDLVAAARHPIEHMRPAIAACWDGYRAASGLGVTEQDAFLERACAFVGARLILTAYETAQTARGLNAAALLHLQVACNVLADPASAGARLLGLTLSAVRT